MVFCFRRYIRIGNIMMIPEDVLKYLTLNLVLFKKNEKYKMEVKKEIK